MNPSSNKQVSISIIIPVYNEAARIESCLEAIKHQQSPVDEVIVVDNNCSDDTIDRAQKYPFVRIVKEKQQGLIAARNRGFDEANMSLLARIDADTVVQPQWSLELIRLYESADIAAGSGTALTYLLPGLMFFKSDFWSRIYFWYATAMFRIPILWGANFSVRKEVWQQIKNSSHTADDKVHEDQDLSCLLWMHGYKVGFMRRGMAQVATHDYVSLSKMLEYRSRLLNTKKIHFSDAESRNSRPLSAFKAQVVLLSLKPVQVLFMVYLGVQGAYAKLKLTK